MENQNLCQLEELVEDKDHWTLSFGDLDKPDTDVEVEFTPKQLIELRKVIDEAQEKRYRELTEPKPKPVLITSHIGSF